MRYILSIILLVLIARPAFAGFGYQVDEVLRGSGGATSCTPSTTLRQLADDDYWSFVDSNVENYQQIKNSSAITICSLSLKIYEASDNPTVNVEIWNEAHTVQYGASKTMSPTTGTPAVFEVTWEADKPAPTGDFRIYFFTNTGQSAYVRSKNGSTSYEDSSYDLTTVGVQRTQDAYFQIGLE